MPDKETGLQALREFTDCFFPVWSWNGESTCWQIPRPRWMGAAILWASAPGAIYQRI